MRCPIGHGRRHGHGAGALARALLWLRHEDVGAVTAEFATILPVVMIIALLVLSLGRTVVVAMDCQDAAAAVARELVVAGEHVDAAVVARQAVGNDASVAIDEEEDLFRVTVDCPVLPGPGSMLPTKVQGKAVGIKQ